MTGRHLPEHGTHATRLPYRSRACRRAQLTKCHFSCIQWANTSVTLQSNTGFASLAFQPNVVLNSKEFLSMLYPAHYLPRVYQSKKIKTERKGVCYKHFHFCNHKSSREFRAVESAASSSSSFPGNKVVLQQSIQLALHERQSHTLEG